MKLSCWGALGDPSAILTVVFGESMYNCGGGPWPRRGGSAMGATARGQATHVSWHHCAKSCRTHVLTAQRLLHASSTGRPNVMPTWRGATAEELALGIVLTSPWPPRGFNLRSPGSSLQAAAPAHSGKQAQRASKSLTSRSDLDAQRKDAWQLWGSKSRPRGQALAASASDHSDKLS